MNKLFLPFEVLLFPLNLFSVFNGVFVLISIFTMTHLIKEKKSLALRPAALVAILTFFIFQLPLFLFSSTLKEGLPTYWSLSISIHIIMLACLMWLYFTRNYLKFEFNSTNSNEISNKSLTFLFLTFFILSGLYLNRVNFSCTGLYSLLVDPEAALLAREVSIKLAGSGVATLAIGIVTNVISPILVVSLLSYSVKKFYKGSFLLGTLSCVSSLAPLLIILLPGAKGALIPTTIAVTGVLFLSQNTLFKKIIYSLTIVALTLALMTTIEILKERSFIKGTQYPYGKCIKQLEACNEGIHLIKSLGARRLSLGLSEERVANLEKEATLSCHSSDPQKSDFKNNNSPNSLQRSTDNKPPPLPSGQAHIETNASTGSTFSKEALIEKIYLYTRGILYRALAIPIQVSSWHFLYVHEHGSPGIYAIPLAIKLFGKSIDMTNLVHSEYGKIYSGGANVSTGTAPTTFLLAYPAYWGFLGLLCALMGLFLFDFIAVQVLAHLNPALKVVGISLICITCINFMLSDFVTTLISHGGGAALLLLTILRWTEKKA